MLLPILLAAAAGGAPDVVVERVRFAPFAVEVNVAYGAGPSARDCRMTVHGTPERHWTGNACGNLQQQSFLNMLGVGDDHAGRLTVVLALEADGERLERPQPEGELMFRTEAAFAVGRNGRLLSCVNAEPIGTGAAIDLCRTGFPLIRRPFVDAAAPERRGRLSISAYEVRAPARDEAP